MRRGSYDPIRGGSLNCFSPLAYAAYGHLLEERPSDLSYNVARRLEHGKRVTGAEYARALRYVEEVKFKMAVLMESYDLLAVPTMPVAAFPIGQRPETIGGRRVDAYWGFNPLNPIFNMTGQPAASLPCGFSWDGLPVGLQLVGRLRDEATVLRASRAFEQLRPWADKRPPVS